MEFDFTKEPGKRLLDRNLNTDGEPLISIVTPFYNAGKYFKQTFNCVMNQTFPWFEWIIVNDGSTNEDDLKILNYLASTDKRIKVFNKENGGIATARNIGIYQSKTDIIIPLDADDLIVPTYLETNFWALYHNPESTWSYTDCLGFQDQEYLWKKSFSAERMKYENILVCTAAIRKKSLKEVGFYDEIEKNYNEDWKLWLKFLSKSKYPVHLSYYGFWYRRIDSGVLSIVKNNNKIAKRSKEIVKEASKDVDIKVKAKEYPCLSNLTSYKNFNISKWDRRVFKKHNKINVVMLLPWMEMGGADLFNLDIIKRINKENFEVSILTTVPGENSWRQKFEDYVTDVFELPSFLDIEKYAHFISYFIKSREIDIIFISNSYYGYYLVPWIRKNFPHIAIVDCVHAETKFWKSGGYVRTSAIFDEMIDKTIVSNEHTKNIMIEKYNKSIEKIQVIYTGIDKEYFNPDVVERYDLKSEYKINEKRPIILFLCRIAPEKRPFMLLEIAKEAKKDIKDICFLVVGDGPQLLEFKEKINEYELKDTVYCVGRKEDIRSIYKISDISLICSLNEGLSINTINSMQMGVPVISSDVGSQYELVNNESGRLIPLGQNDEYDFNNTNFNEQEIKEYSDAIKDIVSDKNKYINMSNSCRAKINSDFSITESIRKIENVFEFLVNNKQKIDKRIEMANELMKYGKLVDDYLSLYIENEKFENRNVYIYEENLKNELMRIVSSKWGSRLIKIAFKMKLNKLFR